MKTILYSVISLVLLSACSTSRDYLSRGYEDKTMFDIVKRLNKKGTDEDATRAIAQVYLQVQQRHLKNIATYNSYSDISKWDKLINEYNALEHIFNAVNNSEAASSLVSAVSYINEINEIKQAAAEDYYQLGNRHFEKPGREDGKMAYSAYKKSSDWVKDYKDSKEKMEEAYNNSIVNILISPIQDNSFFFNTGWGNMGYNYSNEYFQQNLVRDLGGRYATRYPARFFTEMEARQENLQPDWIVDLTLRNMDIPRPVVHNYSRKVSKKIEIGTDTSGKSIYKTVYATLNIQQQSFNARAQMDVTIVEAGSRKTIAYNNYNDTYNWQAEIATYSGDRRALSNNDLALVNNTHYNVPRREDILNELYRNIYPRVRDRIRDEAAW